MGATSGVLRRGAVAGLGLLLSVSLAGCAGGSGEVEQPDNQAGTPPETSRAAAGVDIANPKNAAAVEPCSLMSDKAITALGLKPDGTRKSNVIAPSLPDSCVWKGPDGSTAVSLTTIDGRSIQVYYENSHVYVDFKRMTVAGYPTVRANKNDPMEGGGCALFMATKKNQVVSAYASVPSEDVGKVDPCELSKKALKLSVSTWPAAK